MMERFVFALHKGLEINKADQQEAEPVELNLLYVGRI